jgi:hypothetical protein
MDMSKKQVEFFAFLIIICTVTAAAILIIDYQIKGSILEESNKMRRTIEWWQNGQRPATADRNRPDRNPGNDVPYPSDMVDSGTTGMETAGSFSAVPANGDTPRKSRPSRVTGKDGPSRIPDTDQ